MRGREEEMTAHTEVQCQAPPKEKDEFLPLAKWDPQRVNAWVSTLDQEVFYRVKLPEKTSGRDLLRMSEVRLRSYCSECRDTAAMLFRAVRGEVHRLERASRERRTRLRRILSGSQASPVPARLQHTAGAIEAKDGA